MSVSFHGYGHGRGGTSPRIAHMRKCPFKGERTRVRGKRSSGRPANAHSGRGPANPRAEGTLSGRFTGLLEGHAPALYIYSDIYTYIYSGRFTGLLEEHAAARRGLEQLCPAKCWLPNTRRAVHGAAGGACVCVAWWRVRALQAAGGACDANAPTYPRPGAPNTRRAPQGFPHIYIYIYIYIYI